MHRTAVALFLLLAACSSEVSLFGPGVPSGGAGDAPEDAITWGDWRGADAGGPPAPNACPGDQDGDGFGPGCPDGDDCDDANPWFNTYCPPCETGIHPGCPCTEPDKSIPCYDGSPAVLGIGVCTEGAQTCMGTHWSECVGQVEPANETCDGLDNDCDGLTDEGVLSPCGDCDPLCDHAAAGPGGFDPFALTGENHDGVTLTLDGAVILDSSKTSLQSIWIANSAEHTVSKLSTVTGRELGRYHVCADPSRTAVDLFGDVWVGCRGDGKVGKISISELGCEDKDGDGEIETSRDLDDDGVISGDEMLPEGQDECVRFVVQPDTSDAAPRALAVDKENHLWVGMSTTDRYLRLHPDDGHVVQQFDVPDGHYPYGAVIDKDGILWASHRQGKVLARIDVTPDPPVQTYFDPGGCVEPYGIAVDAGGDIWMGNSQCEDVLRFHPATETFTKVPVNQGLGYTRGVAASQEGQVWIAHHTFGTCEPGRHVSRIDIATNGVTSFALDGDTTGPVGVALDFDGHLWAVNQCTSSATKLVAATGQVLGTYPVGQHPYTYSDMTGYALHSFTNPTGYYRHLFGGWGIRVLWTALIVDATLPAGTYIKVRVRGGISMEETLAATWSPFFGPFPPEQFPLDLTPLELSGHYLQVELSLFSEENGQTPLIKGIEISWESGKER